MILRKALFYVEIIFERDINKHFSPTILLCFFFVGSLFLIVVPCIVPFPEKYNPFRPVISEIFSFRQKKTLLLYIIEYASLSLLV